ncbi:hypothetical protein [Streptomyces poriferorum]|uniref:Uncharacterized protein n=1 Tax=Streptomyces poriferorum TaxID=2798799 RepID=A0ABY9J4X3_9ACTN|nr:MULTISPECIES: hypothetical protein [unclassified Streptomyces]MDP5309406.1 hypothetical protein [Streptomyces sp. Alt4]WLQ61394.1 hypothetical protein P8A19_40970 [Streptomyces sp. Alt2]
MLLDAKDEHLPEMVGVHVWLGQDAFLGSEGTRPLLRQPVQLPQ